MGKFLSSVVPCLFKVLKGQDYDVDTKMVAIVAISDVCIASDC